MDTLKNSSLKKIEQKMEDMDVNSMRYHLLKNAKEFKTSWVNLGRALYTVWNDKLYKNWGFQTFEAYTAKEIGIKKQTAMKLLRSYYFLEKEESWYLQKENEEPGEVKKLPDYETINTLRLVKNKRDIGDSDYANFHKDVFENGKDARQIKRDLTALIKGREEISPQEARKQNNLSIVKRMLTTLKTIKRDIEVLKILPHQLVKEINSLIDKIEAEI